MDKRFMFHGVPKSELVTPEVSRRPNVVRAAGEEVLNHPTVLAAFYKRDAINTTEAVRQQLEATRKTNATPEAQVVPLAGNEPINEPELTNENVVDINKIRAEIDEIQQKRAA